MRKLLLILGLSSFMMGAAAFADPLFGHVRLNINLGGPPVVYQPAPVYQPPIYQPQVYEAPPVIYQSPQVYERPSVVYQTPSYFSGYWGGRNRNDVRYRHDRDNRGTRGNAYGRRGHDDRH